MLRYVIDVAYGSYYYYYKQRIKDWRKSCSSHVL